MKEMKLISMTEFVITIDKQGTDYVTSLGDFQRVVTNYANFLDRKLELWMFVPCGEDGKVLEEPMENQDKDGTYFTRLKQYQAAKERVFFEGRDTDEIIEIFKVLREGIQVEWLADLPEYDFEIILTKSAIKQLGL